MLLADCGSAWAKILDTESRGFKIISTQRLISTNHRRFDLATGHTGRLSCQRYENELVALAYGAKALVAKPDFTVVDIGARDTKLVVFSHGHIVRLDWNTACASSTGATLEMLGKYYDIDYDKLKPSQRWFPVTCGVFGMEHIMETVAQGGTPQEGIVRFIHGLVRNVWHFAGQPAELYLSGGFCKNRCFILTLRQYCKVKLLGRGVLLCGLKKIAGL